DADNIDLVINIRVTDKIRAAADVTWEHGVASEDDRGNAALEYGFVEYSFSDLARVRFGKMFTPFGVFNEIHTAKPAFLSVKEAPSVNKTERIVEGGYRFFPRWGTGIALQGDGLFQGRDFDYDLMISNGEQEETNPFEEDNNDTKALTGRVRYQILENLRLGYSFYYDDAIREVMIDEETEAETTSESSLFSQELEAELWLGKLRILAEVAHGSLDPESGGSQDQLGWYIQPSYHFDNGITPYLRYGYLDPDRDVSDNEGMELVAGVNIAVNENFIVKIENDYFHGEDETNLAEFPGNDYNEIKAAVVLGF
ncbi:MAG: hypothetical protein AAF492_32590, partial [Verrucomicrobiota bacterium]